MSIAGNKRNGLCLNILFGLLLIGCSSETGRMRSTSMEPTIRAGQTLLLKHSAYKRAAPSRWDIVFFEPVVDDGNATWVMRIVGLPGETISITHEGIFINGQLCRPPDDTPVAYGPAPPSFSGTAQVTFPFVIPTNAYFVLGDNVTNAYDSRFWGSLPRNNIKGKVMLPRKSR